MKNLIMLFQFVFLWAVLFGMILILGAIAEGTFVIAEWEKGARGFMMFAGIMTIGASGVITAIINNKI